MSNIINYLVVACLLIGIVLTVLVVPYQYIIGRYKLKNVTVKPPKDVYIKCLLPVRNLFFLSKLSKRKPITEMLIVMAFVLWLLRFLATTELVDIVTYYGLFCVIILSIVNIQVRVFKTIVEYNSVMPLPVVIVRSILYPIGAYYIFSELPTRVVLLKKRKTVKFSGEEGTERVSRPRPKSRKTY